MATEPECAQAGKASLEGPLAAFQALLLDHGWIPLAVDRWLDPRGREWQVDYAITPALLHLVFFGRH